MNEHVSDRLAELLSGELDDTQRRKLEEHMARCEPCAREVAWSRRLQEAALRQGLRHVEPARILRLARCPGDATAAEAAHLESCDACGREIEWSARLEENPPGEEADDVSSRPVARWSRWAAAALAAAAVIVVAMLLPRDPRLDSADLARIEPLPVRTMRSIHAPGSFDDVRFRGLKSYADGDYAAAAEQLARASRLRPEEHEVLLYLASATLLQGRQGEAERQLRVIAVPDAGTAVRHEALWLLAQIALLDHRVADARRYLERVAEEDGRHAAAARRLRDELDGGS